MTDLSRAKELLATGNYTIALCRDEQTHLDARRGIAPMLDFLERGVSIEGFSVADRVVGKAAALLFVRAGIRSVYAAVISESALTVLRLHGISCEFSERVAWIVNRQGDGPCPMERAVREIEDPVEAECVLRRKLRELQAQADS